MPWVINAAGLRLTGSRANSGYAGKQLTNRCTGRLGSRPSAGEFPSVAAGIVKSEGCDMRMSQIIRAVVVTGSLCFAASMLMADSLEERLDAARRECEQRMSGLRTEAAKWRWIGGGFAALGGVTASLTGLTAGLTAQSQARRRWGYVALVSGALAAASPFLPQAEEFRRVLLLADRHYVVGLKVQRQLSELDPARSFRREVGKYAISRFTECIAEEPPKEVPDLPEDVEEMISPGPL
jgi:hypothetical protein